MPSNSTLDLKASSTAYFVPDLDLGHQVGAINYQIEQTNSRLPIWKGKNTPALIDILGYNTTPLSGIKVRPRYRLSK
jgi:hypothetical protein